MKEYRSTLAELIQSAVTDCIEYGSGKASKPDDINIKTTVYANWGENERDIEVTIEKAGVVLFSYIEQNVAGE